MGSNGFLVALPFIVLVMGLRLWRGSKARKLRIERLWIRPVFFLGIVTLLLASQPPPITPLNIILLVIAAGAGLAFGWWRARMVRITINAETHELSSQQSPWGLFILLGLMLARSGLRSALGGQDELAGLPVVVILDALTLFYGGSMIGLQAEVWLRARKLLAETIAAKAAGQVTPAEVTQDHA